MKEIELVIFDFDDTILHLDVDWPSVKTEILSLAAEYGIKIDRTLHLAVIANELSKAGVKERIDEIFLKYETDCVKDKCYRLFPKMSSLIKELDSGGIKLAIASGNHTRTITEILSQVDLIGSFDLVCGRDKVKKNKPDPDQLLFIMDKLKIPKEKTIFAGDSLNDEGAAKAAGLRYIQAEPGKTADLLRALLL